MIEDEADSPARPVSVGPGDVEGRHELKLYEAELAAQNEELRSAQAALELSRTRFRDLYADAPVGFFTIGIQGRILDYNARGAELLRLTTTATRRRLTEFMTPDTAAAFKAKVAQLYRTNAPTTFECELRRADGKWFWAEFAMSLSADSASASKLCQIAMTDVSDRKRMQDDTARLVAIVASSAQAIIGQDLDGTIRSWNPGAERLFGYPAATVLGHTINLIVPDECWAEEQEIRNQVGRFKTVALESVRMRQDGLMIPVFVSAAPILTPSGNVAGVSTIMRDITEQVEARKEVARLMDDLRRADRRKDEFIATLAHELRNPLAPIRNAAALMRLAPDLSPKLKWCRDVIDRQVAHMSALLDDLLDVSRLTRDKITLHRELIELGTAISHAVEINRHLIEDRGHTLTVQLAPQPIEVEGDLTRLIQVFGNLINNAAKYTPSGGAIGVSTSISADKAMISVSDSGIGISPDHLSDIFDLFAQVDPARDVQEGGLGIGLALVKGLVERHGGSIVARSQGLGRGSEFIVCLPLARRAPLSVTGEHDIVDNRRSTASALDVLVVDDNVDAAETLAQVLEADHHAVRTAHDGEEALKLAGERVPDVMVLDLGMPRMSGYEVARRVREQSWGGKPVLIACTGWGQPEDRRLSEESGFDFHLVKPVSASAVLRLVRGVESRDGS